MSLEFQDFSIFWILFCVLLGLAYSYVLYRTETKFNKKTKLTLAVLRALVVFLLSIFLFSPLITHKQLTYEKPIVLIAQDNSESILLNDQKEYYQNDYLKQRKEFIQKIAEKFEVKDLSFGSELKTDSLITYKEKRSNLSLTLQEMINGYRNRNLAAVVLATDGIHNTGPEPSSYIRQLQSPVYTILMGDSIPKRDLRIADIIHNDIVYRKNDFMVEMRIHAYDLKNKTTQLSIEHKGKIIWRENQNISTDNQQQSFKAILNAAEPGMQKYTLRAEKIEGEKNTRNNQMDFYIEVLENKQQIALIAAAVHPDVSAIKSSIEQNENYQVDLILADELNLSKLNTYQMLILHQLPSRIAGSEQLFNYIESQNIPTWVILGNQSYVDMFNREPYGLKILNSSSSANEVLPVLKAEFQGYVLSNEWNDFVRELPPLYAPYGTYRPSNGTQTLFLQKIGSVLTDQPLLCFGVEGSRKYAILSAEGIWKWRMENIRLKGNANLIDELISKTVQYLSSKDDKRKFRVVLPKYKFEQGEKVAVRAELYNDSYELVNSPEVKFTLSNEKKKSYDFLFSKTEKSYSLDLDNLEAGEYVFNSETSLGNKKYSAEGRFTVLKNDIEAMNTTADFNSLRLLSKLSGAKAFKPNQWDELASELLSNDQYKTISYEENKTDEWISLKWIFFLFISLLTAEWLIRKYHGSY